MKPAALSSSLLIPALLSVFVLALDGGCASKTPASWWQQDDACPDGAKVEQTANEIYCATETGTRDGRYNRLNGNASLVVSGAYQSGVEDGTWTRHKADGDVVDSFEIRDGTGLVKVWRDDGSIESEHELANGVKHGSYVAWSADSRTKLEEGRFKKANKVGTWIHRNDKNEIVREVDYRAGEVWTTRHFENGALARYELSDKAEAEAKAKAKMLAMTRDQDSALALAKNAGLFGLLSQQQGGAFASLTGTGDFSSALDDANVYGGLLGNEVGEMQGGFGYGVSGTGPGGGGTGWGTIGTGKYGQIGRSGTTGKGYGKGYGKGSGRVAKGSGGGGYGTSGGGAVKRRKNIAKVRIGTSSVSGVLDKNIIRRYIRRQATKLRYCYERELLKQPALSGTIVVAFTISSAGKVIRSTAKGMGNKSVERCVQRTIRSIVFPKPTSGSVSVRYPFVFSKS